MKTAEYCGEAAEDGSCESAAATDVTAERRLSPGHKTSQSAGQVGRKTKCEGRTNRKRVHVRLYSLVKRFHYKATLLFETSGIFLYEQRQPSRCLLM